MKRQRKRQPKGTTLKAVYFDEEISLDAMKRAAHRAVDREIKEDLLASLVGPLNGLFPRHVFMNKVNRGSQNP